MTQPRRHGLVDDGDERRALAILRANCPSFDDRQAERVEVARAHHVPVGFDLIGSVGSDVAGRSQTAEPKPATLQRDHPRRADAGHPRDRRKAIEQTLDRTDAVGVGRVAANPSVDLERIDAFGLESDVGHGRFLQRSQEQTCDHEQQQRDRDLRGYESLPEPCAASIGAGVRTAQLRRDVDARGLQCRQERERNGRESREHEGEAEHARTDVQVEGDRQRNAGLERLEQADDQEASAVR